MYPFSLQLFPKLLARSNSLVAPAKQLELSTLGAEFASMLAVDDFFDNIAEGEDLFVGELLDSIDIGSFAAAFIVNEDVDDIGASSRELLLEDTQEYDFMLVGCIKLVEPVRAVARES